MRPTVRVFSERNRIEPDRDRSDGHNRCANSEDLETGVRWIDGKQFLPIR